MKKLFLDFKFVGEKLDIVHYKKIVFSILFFKKMDVFVLNGEDIVVGEFFRSKILDLN